MMIIGQIGVRAGSKGVPGKNFRDLHGKPLIDWALDQLIENSRIDQFVVSTDSPEMYAHGTRQTNRGTASSIHAAAANDKDGIADFLANQWGNTSARDTGLAQVRPRPGLSMC